MGFLYSYLAAVEGQIDAARYQTLVYLLLSETLSHHRLQTTISTIGHHDSAIARKRH